MAVDLGFVGEPSQVDTSVIDTVVAAGMIPVVAPIGAGVDGHTYNINAGTMAGAIPHALGAARLFLLTALPGVLDTPAQRQSGWTSVRDGVVQTEEQQVGGSK